MKPLASLFVPLFISLPAGSALARQTVQVDTLPLQPSSACSPTWLPTFGAAPGTSAAVLSFAVFDDGGGGGPALFAGGEFTAAGAVATQFIAQWDGYSWSAVGSGGTGFDNHVHALTVFDDGSGGGPALYAGGKFTTALNYIAEWNGTSWSPLGGGVNGPVFALAVFDDGSGGGPALYAGGQFNQAGGIAANCVAKWDGSNWSPLGNGTLGSVYTLTVFDDGGGGGPALYAGGDFSYSGVTSVNRIAKWDGANWSPLGSGVNGLNNIVRALTVFDDGSGGGAALYAGGDFCYAGLTNANGIAKWDGASWSPLGSGIIGTVRALTVFDDGNGAGTALYAGGHFSCAGGVSADQIAKWDGTSWSPLGSGLCLNGVPYCHALTVFDDGTGSGPALYAGGEFELAGGMDASNIAKLDGSGWSVVGGAGPSDWVDALTVWDDGGAGGPALYAGGNFSNIGGVPANRVAKWDGLRWSALGSGVGTYYIDWVFDLAAFDDGSGGGPALYAAGQTGVEKWDGSSWSNIGLFFVTDLEVFDDGLGGGPALYAVHGVTVKKWDGSSWSLLGNVMGNNWFNSLTVFDDGGGPALYAGGNFTSIGAVSVNRVAKWDGSQWSAVGSGLSNWINALTVFDDGLGGGPALYAGGRFDVAKWDGSNWLSLGLAGAWSGSNVYALAAFDDGTGAGTALYAGGLFNNMGGVRANNIAKWDGASWSRLEDGLSGMFGVEVLSMAVFDDGSGAGPALFAGGSFTVSPAGDSYLAKWGCPAPLTTFCTAKTTSACGPANIGATGASSAIATSGFVVQARPVLGCRRGLLLYSNQPVQPAASFGGPGNGLLCLASMGLRCAGAIESGGGQQSCDGVMSIDMNAFNTNNWTTIGCNPSAAQTSPAAFLGNMGTTVNAQMWGRDSIATGQVLSDGISWAVGP